MNVIERIFQSVSSFRSKQRLVIMLACSIVLVVTLSSFLAYNYFSFNRESRERLSALGDIIGADIGPALALGDEHAVNKYLTILRADPSIKQLFVLNKHDRISAYYNQKNDEVPADLQQRLSEVQSEIREINFDLCPEIERPIIRNGIRLGTILIEQDEHIINGKIATSAGIGAIILLFAFGFSYLLADRFQRVITDPVTVMANTMREVSYTKDYSKRVQASGTDEMDRLAEHFNEMLSEIERRDESLLKRQDQLHQLAQELTRANIQQKETSESNRRLKEVSQTKSDFLANMSHELRTPLNSVIGFSEVLQDQMFGPINEKQQEYVNHILSSGRHLLSLINDILDLSKVESGKMELELTYFSLRETIDASMMMLREKALKGEIELHMDLSLQADVLIVADQRKLKQILYNLLSNAVKFTPAGGTVDVSGEIDGDFIEITVADTGIGIKEEDIQKLFQTFTQLEYVYTKGFEGTGLGLALTRQLVELHGGRVWVKSHLGKGSSFSFTLPLSQVATNDPPSNRPETLSVSGNTVLLIEDDPLTLASLKNALQSKGYRVLRASNGEEGVEMAKRDSPDLIVLDLLMPGMNGFDVADQLQDESADENVPILVLTSMDLSAADREQLAGKVWRVEGKGSLTTHEFIRLVESAIGQKRIVDTGDLYHVIQNTDC